MNQYISTYLKGFRSRFLLHLLRAVTYSEVNSHGPSHLLLFLDTSAINTKLPQAVDTAEGSLWNGGRMLGGYLPRAPPPRLIPWRVCPWVPIYLSDYLKVWNQPVVWRHHNFVDHHPWWEQVVVGLSFNRGWRRPWVAAVLWGWGRVPPADTVDPPGSHWPHSNRLLATTVVNTPFWRENKNYS